MTTAQSTICISCWQNMRVPIPLRGPLSIPFRVVGIKSSRMNPNSARLRDVLLPCVWQEAGVFPATVLFADLRGYTSLSEDAPSEEIGDMLDSFYDVAPKPSGNRRRRQQVSATRSGGVQLPIHPPGPRTAGRSGRDRYSAKVARTKLDGCGGRPCLLGSGHRDPYGSGVNRRSRQGVQGARHRWPSGEPGVKDPRLRQGRRNPGE